MINTALYFALFITIGLHVAVLGPTLPALARTVNSPLAELGVLFTLRASAFLVGSILSARAIERPFGHRLMATALLVVTLGLFFVPLATSLVHLVVVFTVIGLAESSLDLGGNTYLNRIHGDQVAPKMNAMHFCFGIGALTSPLLVSVFAGSLKPTYWLIASLLIPVTVMFWRQPTPPPAQIQTARSSPTTTNHSHRTSLLLLAIFFLLYVGGEVAFGGWIAVVALENGVTDEAGGALLAALFWGVFTAGRLFSIPLVIRFPLKMVLTASLSLCLVALTAFAFQPPAPLWWPLTGLLGLGMAPLYPTMISYANGCVPCSGNSMAWYLVGSGIGCMILPGVTGYILELAGATGVFIALLANFTLVWGVFLIISRRHFLLSEKK